MNLRFISVLTVCIILTCTLVTGAADSQGWKSYPHSFESFTLPEDEGKHSSNPVGWWITKEWWYISGHLQDDDGDTYGYMVCFFSHGNFVFLLTEEMNNTFHHYSDRFWPWQTSISESKLDLSFGKNYFYQVDGQPFTYKLYTTSPTKMTLDLTLDATKPPIAVGGYGLHPIGPIGYTYYYAEPRLNTTGTITIDGVPRWVNGTSWIDRQWGFWSPQSYDGWEWFAVSLDDQTEIEISKMFDPNTGRPVNPMVDISYSNGTHESFDDFQIDYQGYWTSPDTGNRYSSGWNISIPSRSIRLNITPSVINQEVKISSKIIWEGSCKVTGTFGNKPVTGKAYTELVHYYEKGDLELDLQMQRLTFSNPSPIDGEQILIEVIIVNGGDGNATNVEIEVYDGDPNLGGPQIGRRKIKSLTEGSNKAVSFNWTAKAGHH
ncbi:MAG: lipocalin family protein, partial [Halobacteriota archaeon]|nr:lipocalin family protein [Halobacteriota archaeon]